MDNPPYHDLKGNNYTSIKNFLHPNHLLLAKKLSILRFTF